MQTTIDYNPFKGPVIEKVIPIIQAQAEIWIACKMGGEDASRAYNESVSLLLEGSLDKDALENAVSKMISRHEALRATFSPNGRFMTVFEDIQVALPFLDLSPQDEVTKQKTIKEYLSNDANHVFDLIKGPLLKIGVLKLSDTLHQIVITAHHIICDGWSMGIILEELSTQYSAFKNGTTAQVPEPSLFSNYAEEEQMFLQSEQYKETEKFWLEQYQGNVPIVNMPTDFPRPQIRTYKSDRLDFPIPSDLIGKLKKVGIQSGASLVVTLMAGFEVFLNRITGQDDLVLGLPAAGQSLAGNTHLIGHCVNLLPLRTTVDTNVPFNEYLKFRKNKIFDAYEHQQFSFGQLLQKLAIARDPSRVPLVPVAFNIDMGMDSAVQFHGLKHKLKSNPRAFEAFELFMNATGSEGALILEWSYNSSLFTPSTIEKMMGSFTAILESIADNPTNPIGDIIRTDVSAYAELNNTKIDYPDEPLHVLLAKQAKMTPEKTAIQFRNVANTYKEVNEKANNIAAYLIAKGVIPGDYVAVSLPKSIELVPILIAILKTGAAYLPLDPQYPKNRLEFMLEDSEAKLLITTKDVSTTFNSEVQTLLLSDMLSTLTQKSGVCPMVEVSNEKEAYILYTSGSTGKPKGVSITHKNLVNFLLSMLKEPGITENDRLLSVTTISFDIAGLEMFVPLLKGATLVLADEETAKDSRLLWDVLNNENITMMQATPTTWQMLLETGWNKPLPIKALCGGEALPMVLAKNLLEKVNELWNMYGPTETTIWSAVKRIFQSDEVISIGKPIANTQIYIVDGQDRLVEPGNTGELCIAGDGVAKGYWNRPELTSEKFIKNPFEHQLGPILYKTGDLAKLLPNGYLHCQGRIDQQVKIRGHRIELGEIEKELDSLMDIKTSVVLVNNDFLEACVILSSSGAENPVQIDSWKKILKRQLPAYMVPQKYHLVEEFPLTLNGKIDRKTLGSQLNKKISASTFNQPKSQLEKLISEIWQVHLGIEKIDISQDFFELGGHSLIAVRVMTQLEEETGNRLPLAALLQNPTIKALAAYVEQESFSWDCLVPIKPSGSKPPLYIVHGAHHNVVIFKELAKHLDEDQPVYGLQPKGLDGQEEPHSTIEQMVNAYLKEIINQNPDGPYCLAGFSLGGIIAFEMARKLREQGKVVKMLAEFDSYVFPIYYHKNPLKKKIISFGYFLGKVGFIFSNMFSSKKNFKRRSSLIKTMVKGVYLRLKLGREKQYEQQFNRSLKIETNHNKATEEYTIAAQDIVIDLFRSSEEINFVHDKDLLGWKKVAKKGIRKHLVPGNHIDMFEKPNVVVFAEKLQHVLDTHNADSFE